jgi:chromosome segregation ATPase
MQNMRIQDLERETRELQERVAHARANAKTETVEVQVIPPGYATLDEALAAKNSELESARQALAEIAERRASAEQEFAERTDALDRRTKADEALATLVQQFENTVAAFATAQVAVQLDGGVAQFHSTLSVLDSIVGRLHADIRAALPSR